VHLPSAYGTALTLAKLMPLYSCSTWFYVGSCSDDEDGMAGVPILQRSCPSEMGLDTNGTEVLIHGWVSAHTWAEDASLGDTYLDAFYYS
jgi:hypothetical protein